MNKPTRTASINLKLPDELKAKLKTKAEIKQQTVSKYIRELLSNYFDGSLCKNEMVRDEKKSFINSTGFLKLIVWMYSKKRSGTKIETQTDLDNYMGTLKKIEQHLPENLVKEFDKVLFDLLRVANLNSDCSSVFQFADGSSSTPQFDFEKFEKYIYQFEKPLTIPDSLKKRF
ncbi:hypothetical protein [Hwangdonia seohaensis]|uniref:CopG family transcriptional regulator n=1 Tax=Hwangdonia seohaensis TaxID=1240727 RepID=A0ABW3RCP5_9FLAO|nr:hypothetical protein [Hwangdonia seohaensis]